MMKKRLISASILSPLLLIALSLMASCQVNAQTKGGTNPVTQDPVQDPDEPDEKEGDPSAGPIEAAEKTGVVQQSLQDAQQPTWFPRQACSEFWYAKELVQSLEEKSPQEFQCPSGMAGRSCLTARYQKYQNELQRIGQAYAQPFGVTAERRNCFKDWTILIAMDAENNLNEYALWDLYEMEAPSSKLRGGSTGRKDLVIQHDGNGEDGLRRIHVFQANHQDAALNHQLLHERNKDFFLKRSINDVRSPVVDLLPENDGKTKKDRFVEFIKWGMKEYPARNYLVMIWGHGKGWILQDPAQEVHLTGRELIDALKSIQQDSDGLQGRRKIDNFVADACFMQGLELSAAMSPYVSYVSGSAQVQTFLGLPYKTVMREIEENFKMRLHKAEKADPPGSNNRNMKIAKKDAPGRLAQVLPFLMKATLQPNGFQGRIDKSHTDSAPGVEFFTYASVDNAALSRHIQSFENWATAVEKFLNEHPAAQQKLSALIRQGNTVFRAGLKSREFGTHIQTLRTLALEVLQNPSEAKSQSANHLLNASDQLAIQADEIVFSRYFAKRYDIHNGFLALGVWMPRNADEFNDGIQDLMDNPFFSNQWKAMIEAQIKE